MALLIELVNDLGYFAMFIFSWLIFIGLPLPNEAAAAFSGVLTEWRGYSPVIAFISTYLGVISSGTFGYGIGRWANNRILQKFDKSKSQRLFKKAQNWLKQYGPIAISFSYFIPGIRLFMPYIAGASGIPLRVFIMAAFPAAFIWSMIYFQIGRLFPSTFTIIIEHLSAAIASLVAVMFFLLIGYFYYKKRRQASDTIVKGEK
ncbi:MAG: DedA family protein [Bacillota bacterium]